MVKDTIAASSWCWHGLFYTAAQPLALWDVPALAAELGFSAVELNDFMLPPPRFSRVRRPLWAAVGGGQWAAWRYSHASAERLRGALTAAGVRCVAWTVDTALAAPTPRWWGQLAYVAQAVAMARHLGTPTVRLTVGEVGHWGPQRAAAVVSARLRWLAHRWPTVQWVVENHGGLSGRADWLVPVVRSAPAVGLCFDPGNSPPVDWSALAAVAVHGHFKTRAFTPHGREATLPYEQLRPWLTTFTGPMVIEYEGDAPPADGIRQSLALYHELVN